MRLLTALFLLPALAAVTPLTAAARPPAGQIALTFDDLPAISLVRREDYIEDVNRRLLASLVRHRIPAIGFVNEYKLDEIDRARQIAIMRRWLDAGMDLGNHTFSHDSPNEIGVAAYLADIAEGEVETKKLLAARGRKERWFRPPNLETGSPLAAKQAILDWLSAHGYRMAPVTLNATDWQFAEPYDDAIDHDDKPRARRIRAAYLAYTHEMIDWYRAASHALFGRDIAYVMLLHDTRLNADSIEAFAAMLRKERLKPVSIDTAMRDPAYRTPDHYDKPDGIDWMERFAETRNKALPWDSFHDVPKWVQDEYDRLDKDRVETPADK